MSPLHVSNVSDFGISFDPARSTDLLRIDEIELLREIELAEPHPALKSEGFFSRGQNGEALRLPAPPRLFGKSSSHRQCVAHLLEKRASGDTQSIEPTVLECESRFLRALELIHALQTEIRRRTDAVAKL